MYNYYNTLIPEERQSWRSASEIEIAALKHEKWRNLMLNDMPRVQVDGGRKAGILSFLKASLQMLAALFE